MTTEASTRASVQKRGHLTFNQRVIARRSLPLIMSMAPINYSPEPKDSVRSLVAVIKVGHDMIEHRLSGTAETVRVTFRKSRLEHIVLAPSNLRPKPI